MTSEERREERYRRRQEARQAKKDAARAEYDNFERVFSYRNLYRAYRCCRRGVSWKASVQKYITTAPLQVYQTHRRLMERSYRSPGFYEFDLYERGKHRHIRSTVIGERVVQRCLCDNALVPALSRTFIHDNGASLKDKGYTFAVRRFTQHLREHIRRHGREGYILLFDFTQFFDNVDHAAIQAQLRRELSDERILTLTGHFIDMFGDTGLGLGSQISQVLALASANRLDHYVKERLRIRGYGRYMDDGYLIHESKDYLSYCLGEIRQLCEELGITLNRRKTQIVKLRHGFTWLKIRFLLTETGRVVRKIYKRSVTKMRQKLKQLRRRYLEGATTMKDIEAAWQSWASYAGRFDAWHTIRTMRELYSGLFCPNGKGEVTI